MSSHDLNVSTERLETLFWKSRSRLGLVALTLRLVYNPAVIDSLNAESFEDDWLFIKIC